MNFTLSSSSLSGRHFLVVPKSIVSIYRTDVGITLSNDDANQLFETLGIALSRSTAPRPAEPWESQPSSAERKP